MGIARFYDGFRYLTKQWGLELRRCQGWHFYTYNAGETRVVRVPGFIMYYWRI